MVWFNPFIPPAPQAPVVPRPDNRVSGVQPIKEEQQKRSGQDPNRRRRRMFDALMEEVEALPGLEKDQRQTIRDNLREFVRKEVSKPQEERQHPPQHDAHHDDHIEHLVKAVTPEPPAQGTLFDFGPDIPPVVAPETQKSKQLADQMRRCLKLRTDTAKKISSYIHALLAVNHEQHLVEIDV